jgi:hypothetical protein
MAQNDRFYSPFETLACMQHAEKRVSFFEFPSVSVGPEPVLAN